MSKYYKEALPSLLCGFQEKYLYVTTKEVSHTMTTSQNKMTMYLCDKTQRTIFQQHERAIYLTDIKLCFLNLTGVSEGLSLSIK